MMETPITNQMQMLRDFSDKYREPFNPVLFQRSDDDLISAVEDVILSCQRDKYFTIRVDKFTVVKEKEEVEKILHDYEQKKIDKAKAKGVKVPDNPYDFIDINESALMLLIVDYYIAINDGIENPSDTLQVLILLPKLVNKYYYLINGNESYAIMQIVDGSTYNNTTSKKKDKNQNVVYKTLFMPTRLYRNTFETMDCNGCTVKYIIYQSKLFSKMIPIMEYILARFGLRGAMEFMGVDKVISINTHSVNYPWDCYDFEKMGIHIQVPKEIFNNDVVTQVVAMTIYDRISAVINEERQEYFKLAEKRSMKSEDSKSDILADYKEDIYRDIMSDWYWLESLADRFGSKPTVDKGLSVLDSLEWIYDIDSHNTLRLPECDKKDIYDVLKWLIREFPQLRLKDNTDISTKKVRREKYQAAHYGVKLSRGLYRASDTKKKITIDDIKRYINIDPRYLLSRIAKDKLNTYRDDVNDNDAFNALKWSFKGLSGLGEHKNSTVPDSYKYVQPSHLGRIDVDTSSAGDPGMTGILCPTAKVVNSSFADDGWQEPNEWQDVFDELVMEYSESLRKRNQIINLVNFTSAMDVNMSNADIASQQLDLLEATIQASTKAMQDMAEVDATTELYEAQETDFITEDGSKLLIVYLS